MAARSLLFALMILGAVAVFLLLNREPSPAPAGPEPPRTVNNDAKPPGPAVATTPARPQEHPIGEEVEKNHVRVAAVWLASVGMDGRPIAEGRSLIHVEADVKATENNPNGFAKDEFIPYLKVAYKLTPKGSAKPVQFGEMMPMVAFDGLHYGANIEQPPPGEYTLVYELQPPSAGGLGRHSDPVTGVAPWWEPFTASFDWTVEAK